MAIISVSNGARAVILPLRQTGDVAAEQHAITCEALEKFVESNRKNPKKTNRNACANRWGLSSPYHAAKRDMYCAR